MTPTRILHVAVPSPVQGSFDYLPPADRQGEIPVGARVRVSFGRRRVVGVIVGHGRESRVDVRRLKPVLEVLDEEPLLDSYLLALLEWASGYYHHPIGEVVAAALPKRLRLGRAAAPRSDRVWTCTEQGRAVPLEKLARAPKQAALLGLLREHAEGLTSTRLDALQANWRRAIAGLLAKGHVAECAAEDIAAAEPVVGPELNSDQARAAETVVASFGRFAAFLLDGVTGSGKTEVYLKIIEQAARAGRQSLVLAPEIGLTPQLIQRVQARIPGRLAVLHSGLNDGERHRDWYRAATGTASVVIGTRSAVFVPLARPGAIIVDEEHDASFKQQEGFRYHARDLAVWRARQLGVPVILGSATPSLESLHNVERGKYRPLHLPERAGQAAHPRLEVVDVRRRKLQNGLSEPLLEQIRNHLDSSGQVLLFLNRRGFAPALICHDCGWVAPCPRCDAYLTLHAAQRRLRCHHCGSEQHVPERCADCAAQDLRGFGEGTEQVEQALNGLFAGTPVIRIDRDTTRGRGVMQARLEDIRRGDYRLLVGTQMLSKGHDFPQVTLVCALNVDQGLYGADFRSLERMAQLIIQVAGRAGRADQAGVVLLQTHRPEHELLQTLLTGGYRAFCQAALAQRQAAGWPPYSHLVLLRAEATRQAAPMGFLDKAHGLFSAHLPAGVTLLGPAPAPMERRAGRYRAQLLIKACDRGILNRLLDERAPQLGTLPEARRVRWSIDVDPVELD